eukprot:6390876-Amphidinium_carterae.1
MVTCKSGPLERICVSPLGGLPVPTLSVPTAHVSLFRTRSHSAFILTVCHTLASGSSRSSIPGARFKGSTNLLLARTARAFNVYGSAHIH